MWLLEGYWILGHSSASPTSSLGGVLQYFWAQLRCYIVTNTHKTRSTDQIQYFCFTHDCSIIEFMYCMTDWLAKYGPVADAELLFGD